MLDYTKAAFKKTVDDFKRFCYALEFLTQIVYIAYLVYALVVAKDYLWANIILLTVSVAYFVFFLVVTRGKPDYSANKRLKAKVKRLYGYAKKLVKVFTLGVTLYGFFLTANRVTPFSLIFTALMVVGWILQIVFDVILHIISARVNLILSGLEADWQTITKPVKTVGNFFKRMTGQEVEPDQEPTKQRAVLEKKVAEAKEAARLKKEEEKRKKQEEKAAKTKKQ